MLPFASLAGEEESKGEKTETEESLEDELEELKEDDFSDLVGADDDSELMDEFALLAEEDVVFSAAKHKQEITESPSAITVITREQIEYTHCTDVVCLLRQVAEVDVRRVLPVFPVVGARALTEDFGNRALVIVDGREVNFELFGVALWGGLPTHLEDIERIEIIRGPGSALYGANAHSMVVSIITRKTTDSGAEAFIGGGEHDRSSLHLRLGLRLGDWRLHLSGGLDTASHWRIRDLREREIYRARLLLEHKADSATTTIRLGLMAPDGPFYTQLAPIRVKDAYFGNFFLSHQTDLWRGQVSLELADVDLHADMPLYWGETKLGDFPKVVNFFTSNLDLEAQLNWSPFDGNLLIAGGNYRWIHATSGGTDPDTVNQHRVGVFLHDEQRLFGNLVVTAGIRFDYNTITPYAISPRLAGVWQFAENQFLRLAFGQAFRKPSVYETSVHVKGVKGTASFPELGEFFQRNIGNDQLGNEKSTTFEAGYRARFFQNRLTFETDLFYTLYRDTISFQFDIKTNRGLPDLNPDGPSTMKFQNTGRDVDSMGGSVSLTYRVDKTWRINANYTFRHSWYIADPPGGPAVGEGSKGDRVPWEPAHLINFSFHYIPERGLRFGAAIHGSSSSDSAMPEGGNIFADRIFIHNSPILFFSGFLAWRIELDSGWAEIGVRAFNMLNVGFRDLPAVTREDGSEQGGELLGRRIFLFLRACI